MRNVTNGDMAHFRMVALTTQPQRFRLLHEEALFVGYSVEEDLCVFRTADDHVFTVTRGLLEEIARESLTS